MSETKQWSRSWKGSKNPSKQRKYRGNAPHHHRKKFLSAHLEESVREKVGTRTVPVRTGDRVEVMRGDFSGDTGRINDIDTEEKKVYVEGIDRESVDGSEAKVPLRPSNLRISRLNLEDERRLEKYEVSEEEKEEISVEPESEEEPEEEQDTEVDEDVEEEESEDEAGEDADANYADIVEGTVDEVKDAVENGAYPDKVLEAEKQGKDRVTLVEWLEDRVEGGGDE